MLEITYDEISLNDEPAIKTLIDELELPQQYREPKPAELKSFPTLAADWAARPYWARYLDDRVNTYHWTGKLDIWLTADVEGGVLRRLVIKGLHGKREAEALRADCRRVRVQTGKRLTPDDINRTADELFNPIGYPHQRTFESALRNLRSYFKWEERNAVDGEGIILRIGELKLPPEDVELLREVFRRLPQIGGAVTVQDGLPRTKRSAVKSLKQAREKVKQHSDDFADEGFDAWADKCLQTKTERWSRARTPLYEHYRNWIRSGGHGQNRGERFEAKATVLSEVKWGKAMRRRFPDAWRRDKSSILYRVVLKRGM